MRSLFSLTLVSENESVKLFLSTPLVCSEFGRPVHLPHAARSPIGSSPWLPGILRDQAVHN